jgi:hypothetical protein
MSVNNLSVEFWRCQQLECHTMSVNNLSVECWRCQQLECRILIVSTTWISNVECQQIECQMLNVNKLDVEYPMSTSCMFTVECQLFECWISRATALSSLPDTLAASRHPPEFNPFCGISEVHLHESGVLKTCWHPHATGWRKTIGCRAVGLLYLGSAIMHCTAPCCIIGSQLLVYIAGVYKWRLREYSIRLFGK